MRGIRFNREGGSKDVNPIRRSFVGRSVDYNNMLKIINKEMAKKRAMIEKEAKRQ